MEDDDVVVDDQADTTSKTEPDRDATPSSIESSPEDETGGEPSQEPAQPQKRKGGRKPIYATSEERKQRNRQAQAAFRERRTEYIKQLEATIKQNEETLASLQQSHRTAADECLMLRYKNSLLERILLEKGINVQAELQMKTGSPVLGPGFMHPVPVQPQQPQLQRAALQRQQARRSGSSNFAPLPKLAPGQMGSEMNYPTSSPHTHPTPSSHASSPSQMSTQSPMTMHQGGMTPPASAVHAQPQAQPFQAFPRPSQQPHNQGMYPAHQQQPPNVQQRPQRPGVTPHYQSSASGLSSHSTSSHQSHNQPAPGSAGNSSATAGSSASAFYPSPFQKHFDQLDQEYDAQQSQSMLDEPDVDDNVSSASPNRMQGHFTSQFEPPPAQQGEFFQQSSEMQPGQQPMPSAQFESQSHMMPPTSHPGQSDAHFGVDPNDPLLDADPFGLSASMHYPINYSFDQHQGQR